MIVWGDVMSTENLESTLKKQIEDKLNDTLLSVLVITIIPYKTSL